MGRQKMSILLLVIIIVAIGWKFWGPSKFEGAPKSKAEAVQLISHLIEEFAITPAEILNFERPSGEFAGSSHLKSSAKRTNADIATSVFGLLGAVFVLGGLGALISSFWDTMGSAFRITSTLGVGVGLTGLLIVAIREKKYPGLIRPLVFIAAMIQTSGWFVLLQELYPRRDDHLLAMIVVFGIMALQQGVICRFAQRSEVAFTALFYVYALLFALGEKVDFDLKYALFLAGASLVTVSYQLTKGRYRGLADIGFLFGAGWLNAGLGMILADWFDSNLAALAVGFSVTCLSYSLKRESLTRFAELGLFVGSAIFYGGLFDSVRHTPFELVFLGIAVGMMYASVSLGSTSLLITGLLALISFISYYTAEYFVDSIGWPVALIVLGFVFFGVSAFAVNLKGRIKN